MPINAFPCIDGQEPTVTDPVAERAAQRRIHFPQPDGSSVPYAVFSSQEVYDREQERIYRGPFWSFVALACEMVLSR
jgi:anthranilate 1,2-dioxygenase large subunit